MSTRSEGAAELQALFARQGAKRWTIATTDAKTRIEKLKRLRAAIIARQDELYEAIGKDYNKPPFESWLTEVLPSIEEIDHTTKHLRSWMKDRRVKGALILPLARSYLHYEPKGRVLIIAPWNYPFQLLMVPLVSAIAAGNVVIVKPSNKTPATSAFISSLLGELFPRDEVAVVEGPGRTIGELLMEMPFDHIFFTGSPKIGVRVGEAAARIHAGLTLELGGKSPAIILPGADIEDAAGKIMWGKCLNAGQTCTAPDYLLCPRATVAAFVAAAKGAVERAYGKDEVARRASTDLVRIVDVSACQKHKELVDEAVAKGAKIEFGGLFDVAERYAAPTLLTGVTPAMAIMDEEIFGPILPVIAYDSVDEVLEFLNARPKPLSLYLFGKDGRVIRTVLSRTTSGSVGINDVIVQTENRNAPFGGVGMSGIGSYHGIYGFKTFSHERNVLHQGPICLMAITYPPYGGRAQRATKRVLEGIMRMRQRRKGTSR